MSLGCGHPFMLMRSHGRRALMSALGAHMRSHTPPRREATIFCPHPGRECHEKIRPAWEAYWLDGQFPSSDVVMLIILTHSDSF
eukprot:687392-Prymnesium_polylepis.1